MSALQQRSNSERTSEITSGTDIGNNSVAQAATFLANAGVKLGFRSKP
jgi:hypothetical protein